MVRRAFVVLSLGLVASCSDDGVASSGESGGATSATSAAAATAQSGVSAADDGGSGAAATGAGTMDATGVDDTGSPGLGDLDACGQAPGQLFGPTMPWNTPVADAPIDPESDAIIGFLQANVQSDATFQIDFSITVLEAEPGTMREAFEPTGDFYDPDCDPAPVPIPAMGHIEGEAGYTCEGDGDCHLIVIDRAECRLYEQWRANFAGPGDYQGGCLAVWDLDVDYGDTLRGDFCTSADAAGLPIAAHLFDADEVAAGEIPHAIRFILPNSAFRDLIYVRPATHSTSATSGPADAPPYGARLRLRADYDTSAMPPAAAVVAQALKTYGMIASDGGNVTFTAESDDFTTAKWADVGLDPMDLEVFDWTDFEVVDGGTRIDWNTGSCDRTPITD